MFKFVFQHPSLVKVCCCFVCLFLARALLDAVYYTVLHVTVCCYWMHYRTLCIVLLPVVIGCPITLYFMSLSVVILCPIGHCTPCYCLLLLDVL